jgi:iron-sulfur cluster assembly protein
VTLTPSAKNYLNKVKQDGHVTLGVKGGGCSGLTYVWGLSTDDGIDHVIWSDPIEDVLVLDSFAEMHVIGCEIDYAEELGGSFLKINNPNALSSCGCGESFNT